MLAPNDPANVLVVTSQANEAEGFIATLRNGGLAVRGLHSAEMERIHQLVEGNGCDLVLCCGYDPEIDEESVLARHRALETDVPLILVSEHQSDAQSLIRALRAGARDLAQRDDREHLQLVVTRELADLRERRRARDLERRLQECDDRTRELIEGTAEAVAFVQQGLHLHANPAFLERFGFSSLDDLQSVTFLDLIAADQRQPVRDLLRQCEVGGAQGARELATACLRSDGSPFPAVLSAVSSEMDGEQCLRIVLHGTPGAHPASSAGASRSSSWDLACYPHLLGALQARLGTGSSVERPFALFVLRLPGATDLLRSAGLHRGLGAIDALGQSIATAAQPLGTLYRITGDSFALLSDVADRAAAKALEQRLLAEVRLELPADTAGAARQDCEVGQVFVTGGARSPADLLDEAYRLSLGEAPTIPAEPAATPTSVAVRGRQPTKDAVAVSAKVEAALETDRLELVYQPIVSLLGDHQENYSVLARLADEEEDLIESQEFLGAAIHNGLVQRLDKWSVRQATSAIGEHRRAGHVLNFFVHLAEDSVRDPGLIVWICDCLRDFDVRGSWLTFVFQEALVETDRVPLTRLIDGLRKIKCRVAMNRFGASQEPEALLQGIPVDFVLFQPEYAQGLADDAKKQKRLIELANLAREHNVKSVVTGVEEARTLTILWNAGVDYVQGNFLQRPTSTLEAPASA